MRLIKPIEWHDMTRTPKFLVLLWLARILRSFDCRHPCAIPARAAAILKRPRPNAEGLTGIARALGTSPQVLLRQFERRYGLSPAAFHRRVRTRAGITALCEGMKVEAAAWRAGFDSTASLYRALDTLVGLTPTDVRHIDIDEMERLWHGPLETEPAKLFRGVCKRHQGLQETA